MTIFVLVASSFFATNVDNLLLLVGWMLSARIAIGRLAVAYAIAAIAVLLASLAFGLSANLVPMNYVGYLGLVPILRSRTAGIRCWFSHHCLLTAAQGPIA